MSDEILNRKVDKACPLVCSCGGTRISAAPWPTPPFEVNYSCGHNVRLFGEMIWDVPYLQQSSIFDTGVSVQLDPYQFTCNGMKLDPYRVARIYDITDPVIFQALKKLLRCGRKHKDMATDVREAVTSLLRWEEMNQEDKEKL